MTTKTQMPARDSIVQVYSGRAGRCCCGCAGNHTYSSHAAEQARTARGYEVTVNNAVVSRIYNTVKRLLDLGLVELDDIATGVSVEHEGRCYILYTEL